MLSYITTATGGNGKGFGGTATDSFSGGGGVGHDTPCLHQPHASIRRPFLRGRHRAAAMAVFAGAGRGNPRLAEAYRG